MKIKTINILYPMRGLPYVIFLYILTTHSLAGIPMSDEQLSEQTDVLTQLTPIIIQNIKADTTQSTEQQNIQHVLVAKNRADEEKQNNIYSTVLTEYELQKKNTDSSVTTTDQHIPTVVPFRLVSVAESLNHRHDVRITTKDKITVYLGRDGNGN